MRGAAKYAFWKIDITTAAIQLKTTLYTDDAVPVDSIYDPINTKRGHFEDL